MVFPITNRKIKKLLRELELECKEQYGEQEFAFFGQLLTHNGGVELRLGTFSKAEKEMLNNIIKNRIYKEADVKRNEYLQKKLLEK